MKNRLSVWLCILFFSLLCLLLMVIWFRDGRLLATGEDSLMLVNPDRAIEVYKHSWQEVVSGQASPGFNARLPLLYIESLFLKKGIPIWIFQANLFFLLMDVGSISMFFLSKELLKKKVKENLNLKIALIAALFYIFNPVSLLTIWDRGVAVYSFIFFYALNPLFLYLYIVGVNTRKASFIILSTFVTLFFSTAFSSASEPFLLWVLPFIYSILMAFFDINGNRTKFRVFPIIYLMATFIFWVLANLWWIFPWVRFANTEYFSQSNSLEFAVNNLKANSKDFTLDNVVRLIHGGYLFRSEAYGSIYKSPIFLLISWLMPIITIYGLFKLDKGRVKLFFLLSFIIVLFAAKGTSFPFGGIFLWFFTHISVLQIFRNSFEKIGMLLPSIYAPLFGLGVFYFIAKYLNLKTRVLIFALIIISILAYNWPFFTGALVKFGSRDIRVEVPPSFNQANQALKGSEHIILSVPVMGGTSGLYKWQYGFKGIEAGQYLFNYPVVTASNFANTFYGQILIGMSNGNLNNLVGSVQFFSADIVAYRKDTDLKAYGYNLDSLDRFDKLIRASNLINIFDSKEVSLWSLPKERIVPIIYTPSSITFGDSPQELISLLEKNKFNPKEEAFICNNKDKCSPYLNLTDSLLKIDGVPEKIEINKISPANYIVKIYNSPGKFVLVFNNTYHPDWTATFASSHIVANGYANGFIINRPGNFEISLAFSPEPQLQKSYKISIIVTIFGALVLLPLLIFEFKRSKV